MEENMKFSIERDAIHRNLFYFRKNVLSDDDNSDKIGELNSTKERRHDEYTLMTINTIFNGNVRQIKCIIL